MYTDTYTCVYTCIYAYICVCINMYIYAYIHIYIYVHLHMFMDMPNTHTCTLTVLGCLHYCRTSTTQKHVHMAFLACVWDLFLRLCVSQDWNILEGVLSFQRLHVLPLTASWFYLYWRSSATNTRYWTEYIQFVTGRANTTHEIKEDVLEINVTHWSEIH